MSHTDVMTLQRRVRELEAETALLKRRLAAVEKALLSLEELSPEHWRAVYNEGGGL